MKYVRAFAILLSLTLSAAVSLGILFGVAVLVYRWVVGL